MSDDLDTGQVSPPDPVQQAKDNALGQMARSEDASAYIAERQDRDREDRGEEIDEGDRASRIRKALEQARADTTQARNGLDQQPDLDTQFQDAQAQWDEAQAQEVQFEQEREAARNEGRFQAVAENLKQVNPQTWQTITDTMATVDVMLNEDQIESFKRGLTRGNAAEGMAIAHRLSQPSYDENGNLLMSPEQKIEYLAQLPPDQLEATLNGARQWLQMEHTIGKRFAAQYANAPRRVTRAPAPFSRPRGGASAPRSLESLASKESPQDYIRARQAQLKKDER